MDNPLHELREILDLQRETVHLMHRILKHLQPIFTLHITHSGANMAAITAGQSGSFFLTATASDNSTVSLASPTLTADDTTVTIAPDTTDPAGLTFAVRCRPRTPPPPSTSIGNGSGDLEHVEHAAVDHSNPGRHHLPGYGSCHLYYDHQREVCQMSVILYPREVICGSCGTAMILDWHNPLELSQGGTPVYQHPDYEGSSTTVRKSSP